VAGLPPRPARVRAGDSSWKEDRLCDVRVGRLRGVGIGLMEGNEANKNRRHVCVGSGEDFGTQ
jgi:hypothetical protein